MEYRIALIPAYQPDEKLPALAREAESKGFSVIVVDDGSGPAYTELFEETQLYATVLTHPFNQGKGCAVPDRRDCVSGSWYRKLYPAGTGSIPVEEILI